MRRREFITLFFGTAAMWPLAARAQQPGMQVVGFLNSASPRNYESNVNAFREGLANAGYVAEMSRSNIAGQKVDWTDCQRSPPT
jgi:putative ABC transport system substrate-binding protein